MMPEQRDIVLIPVPFTDLSATKKRPVLVLSRSDYNRVYPDVLVAAITSNLGSTSPGIAITSTDLEEEALPVSSFVRVR